MATQRPGNTEVPPEGTGETGGLVTYESPASTAMNGSRALARWWPVVVLLVGIVITVIAMWNWTSRSRNPNAGELLELASESMLYGDLPLMHDYLETYATTSLESAEAMQQGEYYTLAADWIVLWQQWNGVDEPANHRRIVRNYEQAEAIGMFMDDIHLERWAMACLGSGTPMAAYDLLRRLGELDGERYPLAQERHQGVYRAWIHATVDASEQHGREALDALREFRNSSLSTIEDQAWAAARMAEIRLGNNSEEAVRFLHADLRRMESHESDALQAAIAELLMLMGRGYRDLGQWDQATIVLQQSIDACSPTDPIRGDAWVLLGQMRSAQGDLEGAFECHDRALEEVPATPSNLPALVWRGEIRSLLGDHAAALADLTEAGRLLKAGRTHPDINRQILTEVYMDRYEAVLLQGWLDHALAYAVAAESLYDPTECPGHVSHAVAAAAGQRARNLSHEVQRRHVNPYESMDTETAAMNSKAASLHIKAAEAHRAAAKWWHDLPGEEDRWRTSYLEAGMHDDAAGRAAEAIESFREALAATMDDDPQRGEIMYRLGQCLQAEGHYDEAATWYESVIDTWPNSPDATRSHVPLARCFEALDKVDEAWMNLQQVVEGRTVLTPGAVDYMEALQELGALGFRSGRYAEAIPHLDSFLARMADPRHRINAQLLLAGCTRGEARGLTRRLMDDTSMSPSMRDVADARRRALLDRASEAYAEVVETCLQVKRDGIGRVDTVRTALIGQGDALYDLYRYEDAIGIYERVAREYAEHPASMHALVQIAGAWVELGEPERAAAAHERALQRLEAMPDDALSQVDSLMDREIWERWMRIMPVGARLATVDDR